MSAIDVERSTADDTRIVGNHHQDCTRAIVLGRNLADRNIARDTREHILASLPRLYLRLDVPFYRSAVYPSMRQVLTRMP